MPDLPIPFGPLSNGEYDPVPPSAVEREAYRRAMVGIEANAARTGMSRRHFLRTLAGAATVLVAIDACAKESSEKGKPPGGTFDVPKDSTVDDDAARERLSGEETIFDIQTHLLEGAGVGFGSQFPQARCGDGNCFSIEHWMEEIFVKSDTDLVVLSAIPVVGPDGPLSPQIMEEARRVADAACQGGNRVVLHGHVTPTVGSEPSSLEAMERAAREMKVVAWKAYTHAGGRPWYLDDHDPAAPRVGESFIRKAVELGVPRIAVHKGLSGGSEYASPVDIGPAAKAHPDVSLIVYHSGYESRTKEGPYDAAKPNGSIDRLIATLESAGVGPNRNVYAELGSTWYSVMRDPDSAAHTLGKLLKHVGQDNVVWGTDSIWYGSPQGQIQAFRAFEISPELQERHGYPALTPEVKAKVLGANALRLHGVPPPPRDKCELTRRELEDIRKDLPSGNAALGPRTREEAAAVRANDWAFSLQ